ncbi:2Fe-2S iron-sulfur cluster-binding protein [Croceicoccus gelatinilyticus]|uniref:2Fe-2S iron-sulfur cluster-binding protein n=1 Tax=Croceicoccus gelatinilyticus TaxID=2835536 RepID=UPI001BD1AB60|nr:2Fe-2S iron-sulfur cluster-binding protein [Croceicoccus gelatinilyticus]MBS7668981.1 2Fe-2S iron-sulfur cluster binding domain-containing protein [Croceicoccus gelatinilyticus]
MTVSTGEIPENDTKRSTPAPAWRVEIAGSQPFTCREDQTVLDAMRCAGLNPLAIGCRGGGCGVCRVRVQGGEYVARPMSTACVPPEEALNGLALACRIMPRGNLTMRAAPIDRCKTKARKVA